MHDDEWTTIARIIPTTSATTNNYLGQNIMQKKLRFERCRNGEFIELQRYTTLEKSIDLCMQMAESRRS